MSRLAETASTHRVSGVLNCVGPLGEFNGDAYVDLQGLEFSGVADWNAS